MTVAIIDYGSGNLRSAAKAFERAARDVGHGQDILVTSDAERVRRAERIVLPGVGAFGDCRAGLDAVPGMIEALQDAVIGQGRPLLGICIGMQLMATVGREHGDHPGLGWIPGEVVALEPSDPELKIPHMGWNDLEAPIRPGSSSDRTNFDHPVLAGLGPKPYVYFVHGYQFQPDDPAHILAQVAYGGPVVAAVGRDNLIGTQFHPEKSQAAGLRIIGNFLRWRP